MITIESLDKTNFDTIFTTFSQAFSTYEVQLNREQLFVMLKRRGFVPELSFGAFEKDKLVAFTLNGIGFYNGIKTAYDTGTGTVETYRGKGLASNIFKTAIPFLREAGIEQYVLEVLQHNNNAVSIYKKLDFDVSREFSYFVKPNTEMKLVYKILPVGLKMKETSLAIVTDAKSFWDFEPSWQNNFEAIKRSLNDFIIIGAFVKDELKGYCVFEPKSGDITQIAVNKYYRRMGIGTALLKEMIKVNLCETIKVVNIEISCKSMSCFLESMGVSEKGKQYEMIKKV